MASNESSNSYTENLKLNLAHRSENQKFESNFQKPNLKEEAGRCYQANLETIIQPYMYF